MTFQWTRSEVLGLAKEGCAHCRGYGLRSSRTGVDAPCNCVLRAIFRACYRKFRYLATQEKHMSRVRLEPVFGKEQRRSWSLTDQEYIADFCIVAKRSLSEAEHRLFRFHFLLGADWKLCCRQLNIDRGNFFHEVYRIQQKLGKVFRELEPYALFPLDEYFGGSIRKALPGVRRPGVVTMPETAPRNRLLPPVRKAA